MYRVFVYDNKAIYPTSVDYGKFLNEDTFRYYEGAVRKFTDYIIDYKAKETEDKFSGDFDCKYTTIDVTLIVDGCIIDSRTFTIQL